MWRESGFFTQIRFIKEVLSVVYDKLAEIQHEKSVFAILPAFILLVMGCNNSQLSGEYRSVNTYNCSNPIQYLILHENKSAELIFSDTILIGEWNEHDIQEFQYIELIVNSEIKELLVYDSKNFVNPQKPNELFLYFVGKPTDFRNCNYDSVQFMKTVK